MESDPEAPPTDEPLDREVARRRYRDVDDAACAAFHRSTRGLQPLREAAEARGVHLLLLVDDKGAAIVATSRRPFQVTC